TSHARQTGSAAYLANKPKPPILFTGDFSRKKNGSPGASAAKVRPPGRQKFTSPKNEAELRYRHQPASVWPMNPLTLLTAPSIHLWIPNPIGVASQQRVDERNDDIEGFVQTPTHLEY